MLVADGTLNTEYDIIYSSSVAPGWSTYSSIWEGASTKSRSTAVPEKEAKAVSEQRLCMTWPNSWKKVVT